VKWAKCHIIWDREDILLYFNVIMWTNIFAIIFLRELYIVILTIYQLGALID